MAYWPRSDLLPDQYRSELWGILDGGKRLILYSEADILAALGHHRAEHPDDRRPVWRMIWHDLKEARKLKVREWIADVSDEAYHRYRIAAREKLIAAHRPELGHWIRQLDELRDRTILPWHEAPAAQTVIYHQAHGTLDDWLHYWFCA